MRRGATRRAVERLELVVGRHARQCPARERPVVEEQLRSMFYNATERPVIVGKTASNFQPGTTAE